MLQRSLNLYFCGMSYSDTIVALATPSGTGAIAVIRVSGPDAITLVEGVFRSVRGKKLGAQKSHTIHLGHIVEDGKIMDEVLVSLFKAPHSYTGEQVVEISCHGSPYIQQQCIQLLLKRGCRMANAGEFTLRAFLNGIRVALHAMTRRKHIGCNLARLVVAVGIDNAAGAIAVKLDNRRNHLVMHLRQVGSKRRHGHANG